MGKFSTVLPQAINRQSEGILCHHGKQTGGRGGRKKKKNRPRQRRRLPNPMVQVFRGKKGISYTGGGGILKERKFLSITEEGKRKEAFL